MCYRENKLDFYCTHLKLRFQIQSLDKDPVSIRLTAESNIHLLREKEEVRVTTATCLHFNLYPKLKITRPQIKKKKKAKSKVKFVLVTTYLSNMIRLDPSLVLENHCLSDELSECAGRNEKIESRPTKTT